MEGFNREGVFAMGLQTGRLFEIIYILLNKKLVTARELAEQFGVSTRTVYRDVDTLSLAGIPVYTEKGKNGGISLLPGFVLNKSILSEQEQHEILSALQGLSFLNNGSGDSRQVLQKLSGVFNKTASDWLEVDFTDWGFDDGAAFNGFKTAILERRVAEFTYFGGNGEKTQRRVEPMQLWFKSKAWYLKGYCLLRQDMRLFKITRVRDLTVTDIAFVKRDIPEPPPKHDEKPCEEYMRSIRLKLKIAPEMNYRVFDEFPWEGAKKQPDGGYIVTAYWPEDDWLYGKILSFGTYAEVLEPPYLINVIKEKALQIANKY
ncbi:MAG: YafY family transcriptional regulator [Defluviitaleaceae bacterium]|nr:YafY family transcriptional regulator [Defluviitaleaceae bacterium]